MNILKLILDRKIKVKLSLGLISPAPRREDICGEWRYSSTIVNLSTRWR
jgi:hypothetical protein